MAGNKGLVSVIIPTYNRGERISESILSCFNQKYKDVEVIVVDDGSTDNTYDVISEFKKIYGSRLVYHKQQNAGACVARNEGLRLASGDFIQFLDSDDLLHPDKFELQITALTDSNSDIAICDFEYVTEDKKLIKVIKNDDDVKMKVASFRSLSVFTPLIRRSLIHSGFKWNVRITRNQDMDFMFRLMLSTGKWIYTPGVFCSYISHSDERISDEYNKGIQYAEQFTSALDFWTANRKHIPSENSWMIFNLCRVISGKLYFQKEFSQAVSVGKALMLSGNRNDIRYFLSLVFAVLKSCAREFVTRIIKFRLSN